MQISTNTRKILANFAAINPSIILKEGSLVNTISTGDNIFASAVIPETIPHQVGIYSISEFLKALSLFGDTAETEITAEQATISEGRRKLKYTWSPQDILKAAPEKMPELPLDVEFTLTAGGLKDVLSGAGALQLDTVRFVSDGENIKFVAGSSKNVDSNSYEFEICECPLKKAYSVNLAVVNLKVIPGDYKVGFCFGSSAVVFKHASADLSYIVAAEKTSSFPA